MIGVLMVLAFVPLFAAIFFNRPIAGVITTVAIFFFVLPIITPWWRRLKGLPTPFSETSLH